MSFWFRLIRGSPARMSRIIVWAISDIDKTSFLELTWQLSYYIHYPVNVDLVWGPYPVIIDLTPQTINNYFAFRKETATTWFVSDRHLKSVGIHVSNQIYLVSLCVSQFTQSSFLQKANKHWKMFFMIFVMLRWHKKSFGHSKSIFDVKNHGLRTPNEDINQRNLKIWADVADKICFGRT